MYKIKLKNNKSFQCDENLTIFEAAKKNNITLEHSCLNSRCSTCMVKVISGQTKNNEEESVLTEEQKKQKFVLSCNAKPLSDLELDIEDLGEITIFEKKIIPAKISVIEKLTDEVIKLVLRIPPNSNFNFNSGQYVNIFKASVKRSYSIANNFNNGNQLHFFIKYYDKGLMSEYFFNKAKLNDLLRIEGPIGTFFLRNTPIKNIIFLSTGTGIAPVKAILESLISSETKYLNKKFWIIHGARYKKDLFWNPSIKNTNLDIEYVPVLSRENENWKGAKGYVQHIVLNKQIDLSDSQVYACGSNEMIESAKNLLCCSGLEEINFFSDAFIQTN
jgi:CDP-4-dehydro-6-deoxyglucose reductase